MSNFQFQAIKQIGYGAMGLEGYYGESDDSSAVRTLVHAIEKGLMIDTEYGITPAQLALAWLVAQGDNIIPIPGSRKTTRIDENLEALSVTLKPETLANLNSIAPIGAFKGATLV